MEKTAHKLCEISSLVEKVRSLCNEMKEYNLKKVALILNSDFQLNTSVSSNSMTAVHVLCHLSDKTSEQKHFIIEMFKYMIGCDVN